MGQGNMSCIVFPLSICDFKWPSCCLNRVNIQTFDDLQNEICLYNGPCMCENSSTMEVDCSAELELRNCPLVILPGNIKMEPVCKQAAGHGKLLLEVNMWTLDMDDNEILLYSGISYVMYSDEYNGNIEENSASDNAASDIVESYYMELFPELSPIELNTTELNTINPCVPNLWKKNGTNIESEGEWIQDLNILDAYSVVNLEDIISPIVSPVSSPEANASVSENNHSYEEATLYFHEDVVNEKIKRLTESQINADIVLYEEDDVGLEETIEEESRNENEPDSQQESEDEALKQLMSSNIQSQSKQRKVILFSGKDSHHGQTIQKMSYNNPNYECPADAEGNNDVVYDPTEKTTKQKKYQCAKCNHIFNQLATFKEHMTDHGPPRYATRSTTYRTTAEVQFTCEQCNKKFKSQDKFEAHCLGHGDPERECNICFNVFASKFSLRTHMKTHTRKYRCKYCTKSFDKERALTTHTSKVHPDESGETELSEALLAEVLTGNDVITANSVVTESDVLTENGVATEIDVESVARNIEKDSVDDKGKRADTKKKTQLKKKAEGKRNVAAENDIISKAVSHEMFLSKVSKKHSKGRKQCSVCPKSFDRVSDLKRHLIEHTLASTLRRGPVNAHGTLAMQCCLCNAAFGKIDKYKAHLREHANLTTYTCTFCDKSFSDSSNFSKHKKIHGFVSFQCDMCQRKFNSKKMLVQHMEYHNKNPPVSCRICDKVFHFESMLKKHIKSAHTKEPCNRFRCRFCRQYYKTLKEKWDHEWSVHNVRKMIADCLVCGAKFRKYSELKRHCLDEHDMEIPMAKNIIKETKSTKKRVRLAYD